MSESVPLGESTAVELEFEYDVSEEFINAMIDRTGLEPPERWQLKIDLHEDVDDPDVRRRLRQVYEVYRNVPGYPVLPGPAQSVRDFLVFVEPWADRESGEADRRAAREAAEAFEGEMERWIRVHGSPTLSLGFLRGYKVNRSYAQERARLEFPGAWVDTASDVRALERTDPTAEALELESAIQAHIAEVDPGLECRIVWMTKPTREMADYLELDERYFEEQEAIAILNYLKRYRLYLPVDVEDRHPGAE
jgi:hypothetical protein